MSTFRTGLEDLIEKVASPPTLAPAHTLVAAPAPAPAPAPVAHAPIPPSPTPPVAPAAAARRPGFLSRSSIPLALGVGGALLGHSLLSGYNEDQKYQNLAYTPIGPNAY